jgi:predicted benzoate:H+ symporter BenE
MYASAILLSLGVQLFNTTEDEELIAPPVLVEYFASRLVEGVLLLKGSEALIFEMADCMGSARKCQFPELEANPRAVFANQARSLYFIQPVF